LHPGSRPKSRYWDSVSAGKTPKLLCLHRNSPCRYYQRLREWEGTAFPNVTIIYEGRPIEWRKFFFTKENYPDAWEICKKTPGGRYPKAFHGEIRSIKRLIDGRVSALLKGTRFPPHEGPEGRGADFGCTKVQHPRALESGANHWAPGPCRGICDLRHRPSLRKRSEGAAA
jgi:hypothetical protein